MPRLGVLQRNEDFRFQRASSRLEEYPLPEPNALNLGSEFLRTNGRLNMPCPARRFHRCGIDLPHPSFRRTFATNAGGISTVADDFHDFVCFFRMVGNIC